MEIVVHVALPLLIAQQNGQTYRSLQVMHDKPFSLPLNFLETNVEAIELLVLLGAEGSNEASSEQRQVLVARVSLCLQYHLHDEHHVGTRQRDRPER